MVVVRCTPETRHWAVSRVNAWMDAVTDIDTQPEQRSRLLDWYVNRLCSGDDRKGQAAFQRDLQRLYELDQIEEYLERLDEEIRVANRRALAFLEYKLRAIRPIDNLLRQTMDRLIANPDIDVAPVLTYQTSQAKPELATKMPANKRAFLCLLLSCITAAWSTPCIDLGSPSARLYVPSGMVGSTRRASSCSDSCQPR